MTCLLSILVAPVLAGPPAPAAAADARPTYTNPVTAGVVDAFPDPATIRAHDGHWYAYGTTAPIRSSAGEGDRHILPILRSDDLVSWTYVRDAIAADATPRWWRPDARAWAPDVRYVRGTYYLTYSLSYGGIALLTSRHPTGPWTDHGLLVGGGGGGCPTGAIDQAMFTDPDGRHYLYWGSYDTVCVAAMNAAGTKVVGKVRVVGQDRRMEGAYVIRRGRYYYLFYSDGSCCEGAFSGYTTKVARATRPTGPFRTPSGARLTARTSHDGIVVASTANGWDGTGHNAIATDLSGQDWLVYHAVADDDPYFAATGAGVSRATRRPMLIDRLDWIGGWPVVNRGTGASTTQVPGPVTAYLPGSTVSGSTRGERLSRRQVRGDVRVEGSLRGRGVGLVVGRATAWLRGKRLVVEVRGGRTTSTALPDDFAHAGRHWVIAERRRGRLHVEVSEDRLHDPVAALSGRLPPRARRGHVGVAATSRRVSARLVGAARLSRPSGARVADPAVGPLLPAYSDEFDDTAIGAAWSWVRPPASLPTEDGAQLTWPTAPGDLATRSNTASVLLRDAPPGDFTVEAKLTFDGRTAGQQAGLVVYGSDDRYVELTHSVVGLLRVPTRIHATEFTKEGPRLSSDPATPVRIGQLFGGPPAPTTWLRLRYTYDAVRDDHVVRMATSTDGRRWSWGGSWNLSRAADERLRIGLVSMGSTGATARFDYVRTYAAG